MVKDPLHHDPHGEDNGNPCRRQSMTLFITFSNTSMPSRLTVANIPQLLMLLILIATQPPIQHKFNSDPNSVGWHRRQQYHLWYNK